MTKPAIDSKVAMFLAFKVFKVANLAVPSPQNTLISLISRPEMSNSSRPGTWTNAPKLSKP